MIVARLSLVGGGFLPEIAAENGLARFEIGCFLGEITI
jgi:hypothetical protein